MEKGIFQFIWRYSRKQQIMIMLMTASSLPFLYMVLDLPKYIINDAIDGKAFPKVFMGFEFNQIEYLMLLCAGLLVLIFINAFFSMTINTYKGVSSERLIRRLRYQLYDSILRFPPRHFQKVSPPEISSMITAEVEPMGNFISDSFSLPMVQGGTMATILFFMVVEDPILGLVAVSMVPIQAWLIPKLQAKVTALGRRRINKARKLAGWVGESVLGVGDIHTNDASNYMQASLSRKLGNIFSIRYQLYQKKFFMKALNNFLSQLTPLFFYSVGGYLIIQGDLSLGALVAVLAAYARFTTPWRQLLKYYQTLNDVKIKYELLIENFQPAAMLDPARLQRPESLSRLEEPLTLHKVNYVDEGAKLLEDVSVRIEPGDNIAIVCEPGARDKFAHLIARTIVPTSGRITVGDSNLAELPEAITGASIGYSGPESYIFSGSLIDNLLYGVRHLPTTDEGRLDEASEDYIEALASGNSVFQIDAQWIDYQSLNLSDEDELNAWMLKVIRAVEMDTLLATRALGMGLDIEEHPELAKQLMEARKLIALRINENPENAQLIHPFDFDTYNANASVAANLVFGEPVGDEFSFRTLGSNPLIRSVLEKSGLNDRFLKIGIKLSETLIELFGDMSPDLPLFESYSFVDEETLKKLKVLTLKVGSEGHSSLDEEEKDLLISLTFQLIVDRHRFGFIDEDFQKRILKARRLFHKELPKDERSAIAFFDQETFNAQLSNRCNLLLGRINHTISGAEQRTNQISLEVLEQMETTNEMIFLATQSPVGVGGSRLSHADRQKVALARSLIKKPDILVINDALSSLDREAQMRIRRNIFDLLPDTTHIMFFGEKPEGTEFKQVLTLRDGRIADRLIEHHEDESALDAEAMEIAGVDETTDSASPVTLNAEASVLSNIPLFSAISPKNLKLLAFSSRRLEFAPGDNLIREGEPGKFAYVILSGEIEIVINAGKKEKALIRYGKNVLIGELALLTEALTTATVRALNPVTALRIEKGIFIQLMEDDGRVASQVASWVSDKLVHSMKLLHEAT